MLRIKKEYFDIVTTNCLQMELKELEEGVEKNSIRYKYNASILEELNDIYEYINQIKSEIFKRCNEQLIRLKTIDKDKVINLWGSEDYNNYIDRYLEKWVQKTKPTL